MPQSPFDHPSNPTAPHHMPNMIDANNNNITIPNIPERQVLPGVYFTDFRQPLSAEAMAAPATATGATVGLRPAGAVVTVAVPPSNLQSFEHSTSSIPIAAGESFLTLEQKYAEAKNAYDHLTESQDELQREIDQIDTANDSSTESAENKQIYQQAMDENSVILENLREEIAVLENRIHNFTHQRRS